MGIVMSEDSTVRIEYGSKMDPETGLQVGAWGFEFRGVFVVDPFLSECGRFEVDPFECYGITRTMAMLIVSKNEALDRIRKAHNIVL